MKHSITDELMMKIALLQTLALLQNLVCFQINNSFPRPHSKLNGKISPTPEQGCITLIKSDSKVEKFHFQFQINASPLTAGKNQFTFS